MTDEAAKIAARLIERIDNAGACLAAYPPFASSKIDPAFSMFVLAVAKATGLARRELERQSDD